MPEAHLREQKKGQRMLRAMDSAVSGLRAHQNKLDVIGNNIANVNTFGFKSQSYSFKEAMYQTSSASTGGNATNGQATTGGTNAAQYGYGTMMGVITSSMGSSTPSYAEGLNACLDGDGFFITSPINKDTAISGDPTTAMKAADYSYTRVGQFSIDENGYLVDGNGNFVYGFQAENDAAGSMDTTNLKALRVPDSMAGNSYTGAALKMTNVQINSQGEVTGTVEGVDPANAGKTITKTLSIGKVAIATFQNPEGLTRSGGGYYKASGSDNSGACAATEAGGAAGNLMTGYLEASNVDLAKEFSEMIMTQRGFQANSKLITVSDEILSELVNMKR